MLLKIFVFCTARGVECRKGPSGPAGVFAAAAESGDGQQAGRKYRLHAVRQADASGQGGML